MIDTQTSEGEQMMHLKKLMPVLGIALLALVFAAPASAYTWTVNGQDLEGEAFEEFEGATEIVPTKYEKDPSYGSSFGCIARITLQAQGSSAGTVADYEVDTQTCGGNGAYTGCVVTNIVANNIPGGEFNMAASPPTLTYEEGTGYHYEVEGCLSGAFSNGLNAWIPAPFEVQPTLSPQGKVTAIFLKSEIDGTPYGLPDRYWEFGPFTATGKYAEEYGVLGLK